MSDPECLQDVCGNRTLATIATHDLSAVKGPLKYTALEPTSFKVEPLSGGKPIRASKVLLLRYKYKYRWESLTVSLKHVYFG